MPTTTLRLLARVQLVALVVLGVSVAVLALFAIQARSAICSFTNDLQERNDAVHRLLDAQPGEFVEVAKTPSGPILVSRDVLENQVAQQQRTLRSLKSGFPPLHC